MNADLARRRPATVVRRATIPAPVVRQAGDLTAKTKAELLASLQRLQRAGRIERAGPLRLITEGRLAGGYAVRVVLLPPRAQDPRWAVVSRNLGIGLMGLAAVIGSLAWLLTALTATALVTVCACVATVFCTWVYVKYGRRGPREVTVTTTVQMR
jgi:hypothetical protein